MYIQVVDQRLLTPSLDVFGNFFNLPIIFINQGSFVSISFQDNEKEMQIFPNIYFSYNLRINTLLDIFIKASMSSTFKCMSVNPVDKCMSMKIGV